MLVEEAAEVYIQALAANGGREPNLVPEELVDEMTERFNAGYGQPSSSIRRAVVTLLRNGADSMEVGFRPSFGRRAVRRRSG